MVSSTTAQVVLKSSGSGVTNPKLPGSYPVVIETYLNNVVKDTRTVYVEIKPNDLATGIAMGPVIFNQNVQTIYMFRFTMPADLDLPAGTHQNAFTKDRGFFQIEFHGKDGSGNI